MSMTMLQEAYRYLNLMRNAAKRRYGFLYLAWLRNGAVGLEPERGTLSVMGAQAVRMGLHDILGHDPFHAVRGNPGMKAVGSTPRRLTIPGQVRDIRYDRPGAFRGPYRHTFQPGVRMVAQADGSVVLRGPRRVWANADDLPRDRQRESGMKPKQLWTLLLYAGRAWWLYQSAQSPAALPEGGERGWYE